MNLNRILFFAFLLTALGYYNQALAQSEQLRGYVFSSEDSTEVPGSHIKNISRKIVTTSANSGYFEIEVESGDTIEITNVAFDTKEFVVKTTEGLKAIYLKPAIKFLEEVSVSNIPETEAAFKKRIVDMPMQETGQFVPYGMSPPPVQNEIPLSYDKNYTNRVGYAINHPISFIKKKLSRNHKMKQKYFEIKAHEDETIIIEKKYNREVVANLTGLKDDQLTDFIQYIDLKPDFLLAATEYEIAERVLALLKNFKEENPKEFPG